MPKHAERTEQDELAEKTVTLTLPVGLDKALEIIAARRGWTKKETVAWALGGRAEVRRQIEELLG